MTVTLNDVAARNDYVATAGQTVFPLTFKFFAASDLLVYQNGVLKTLSTHYTVQGANADAGMQITLVAGATLADTIAIVRAVPYERTLDLPITGPFPISALNTFLAKLVAMVQQLRDENQRQLTISPSEATGSFNPLPAPAVRAGALLGFDDDGQPTLGGSITSLAALDASVAAAASSAAAAAATISMIGVNVMSYGATGDGVTDDTTAIRNAVAAAGQRPVYLPKGRYLVTDIITLNNGQHMQGDDRMRSVIYAPATFNLSALGVVRLATAETGAAIFDVGFEFYQDPAAANRAALIQYPPALYARDAARFIIDRVRISGGYKGVDATGNCGGFYIGRLEMGTYYKGLYIDGILDYAFINSLHFWTFGVTGVGTPLGDIFRDGTNVALEIGLAEQLNIASAQVFRGNINFTANGSGSITPRFIGSLCLDSDNSFINHLAGYTEIGRLYNTKSSTATGTSITVSGGELQIAKLYHESGEAASGVVVSGSARCKIGGGRIKHSKTDQAALEITGGRLTISDADMVLPATNRTVGFVKQSGGSLKMNDNSFDAPSGATGNAIQIGADAAGNVLRNNMMSGWPISLPAGAGAGAYQGNDESWLGYFSSDGATTVKVPSGWSITKNSTGNYSITHSLGLSAALDVAVFLTPHGTSTSDTTAYLDVANSTTNVLRIRTFAAGVAADAALFFEVKRRRVL